jgi:type IV pilus assembly protein PilC
MDRYKYRAINEKGKNVHGTMAAASENDLYNELQKIGLELLRCKRASEDGILDKLAQLRSNVKPRDLLQLFVQLEQMQNAGIPLIDALSDARDTTDNPVLRDVMSEIHRNVSQGSSLSEAMKNHPKVFSNLYTSLIGAGEESGNMVTAYQQLIDYLRWVDAMRSRVRKATAYPAILLIVVFGVIVFMMGYVVPMIVDFIRNIEQEIPWYTQALITTSDVVRDHWWAILLVPVVIAVLYRSIRAGSNRAAYHIDRAILQLPVIGPVIRKISIARYAQTFASLYKSGIDVLQCLSASRKLVSNMALIEAMDKVQESVQSGSSLSEAFSESGEFPTMVVRMVKVGEESGNMSKVLSQVSDFYSKDVDDAVQNMILLIEPVLTALLGGMILWIAVGVFAPIYNSFGDLQF